MGLFSSFRISASGMTAERLRMDVISDNVANAMTTKGADGGPYRRKFVVFEEDSRVSIGSLASAEDGRLPQLRRGGVRVAKIVEDQGEPRMVYDPGHPDANADGYVAMPNIDIVREMVDMITASRAYEANVTAFNAAKSMALKALEIGK